jgi:hypothetical protein
MTKFQDVERAGGQPAQRWREQDLKSRDQAGKGCSEVFVPFSMLLLSVDTSRAMDLLARCRVIVARLWSSRLVVVLLRCSIRVPILGLVKLDDWAHGELGPHAPRSRSNLRLSCSRLPIHQAKEFV